MSILISIVRLFLDSQYPDDFKVWTNPDKIFVASAVEATIGAVYPLTNATFHYDDTKLASLEHKNAGAFRFQCALSHATFTY